MVADNHADRLAQHRAAEILHRHLRSRHRPLPGRSGGRSVHVGENADLDHVVRNLSQRRRRQKHRRDEGSRHDDASDEHSRFSQFERRI